MVVEVALNLVSLYSKCKDKPNNAEYTEYVRALQQDTAEKDDTYITALDAAFEQLKGRAPADQFNLEDIEMTQRNYRQEVAILHGLKEMREMHEKNSYPNSKALSIATSYINRMAINAFTKTIPEDFLNFIQGLEYNQNHHHQAIGKELVRIFKNSCIRKMSELDSQFAKAVGEEIQL